MHKLSDTELELIEKDMAWKEDHNYKCVALRTEMMRSLLDEIRESRKSESTHGAHRIAKAVQVKGSV